MNDTGTPLSTPPSATRAGSAESQTDGPPALALHEAAHALAGHSYGKTVELVSVRPGLTYGGVCLSEPLALPDVDPWAATPRQPWAVRQAYESAIVARLVGPLAGWMLGPPTSGRAVEDPCDTAAADTAATLAALSPRHREMLSAREANPEPLAKDEDAAETLSLALTGDVEEAAAHLDFLRVVAKRFVLANAHMIRRVAAELHRVEVLEAGDLQAIINPPRAKESAVSHRKSMNPEDGRMVDVDDGRQVRLLEPLTLSHSHCLIATRSFWGTAGPAQEGSLHDDRSANAAHHADALRRPTADERSGEAAADAKRIAINTAAMTARKADTAAKAATQVAKVATAALAEAKQS